MFLPWTEVRSHNLICIQVSPKLVWFNKCILLSLSLAVICVNTKLIILEFLKMYPLIIFCVYWKIWNFWCKKLICLRTNLKVKKLNKETLIKDIKCRNRLFFFELKLFIYNYIHIFFITLYMSLNIFIDWWGSRDPKNLH